VKSALARWVLHKRRGLFDADHARPAPHDEATHAWDGRRRFAEDYTFVALQQELALLIRLEWLPGRAAHRLWVVALRDADACCNPEAHTVVADATHDRWRVAGLELDCLRPLSRWTVRYRGMLHDGTDRHEPGGVTRLVAPRRCELELEFEAQDEPFVPGVDDDPELVARRLGEAAWDGELVRSVRRASQRGYVQLGGVVGTLVLGDERIELRASGLRQHTWGVRDWGAPQRAVQCFLAAGGAHTWIQRAQFPAFTLEGGFVARDGKLLAIRDLRHVDERGDERGLELELADGAWRWQGRRRSGLALRVDGRGALDLVLARGDGDAVALWASQRRTLPEPPRR
jgi:hypothetical protein